MLKIILTIGVFALAGCDGSGSNGSWSGDDTAMLLMLGAGGLNGYNAGVAAQRPMVMTTCTGSGASVNCLSY